MCRRLYAVLLGKYHSKHMLIIPFTARRICFIVNNILQHFETWTKIVQVMAFYIEVSHLYLHRWRFSLHMYLCDTRHLWAKSIRLCMPEHIISHQNVLQNNSISAACTLGLSFPCSTSCMWCAAVSMQPPQLYQALRHDIFQLNDVINFIVFVSSDHVNHHCKIDGLILLTYIR